MDRLERGTSMPVKGRIGCLEFPCQDVRYEGYGIPAVEIDPQGISIMLSSEAAPAERKDYDYAGGDFAFERTTLEAFKEAGADVSSLK